VRLSQSDWKAIAKRIRSDLQAFAPSLRFLFVFLSDFPRFPSLSFRFLFAFLFALSPLFPRFLFTSYLFTSYPLPLDFLFTFFSAFSPPSFTFPSLSSLFLTSKLSYPPPHQQLTYITHNHNRPTHVQTAAKQIQQYHRALRRLCTNYHRPFQQTPQHRHRHARHQILQHSAWYTTDQGSGSRESSEWERESGRDAREWKYDSEESETAN
jgi:hypothetical protein